MLLPPPDFTYPVKAIGLSLMSGKRVLEGKTQSNTSSVISSRDFPLRKSFEFIRVPSIRALGAVLVNPRRRPMFYLPAYRSIPIYACSTSRVQPPATASFSQHL